MKPSGEFITLARVVKTQGRHGEVAAEMHSTPERFAAGMKLFALPKPHSVEQGAKRLLKTTCGANWKLKICGRTRA